jgi:hypothetical protein
MASIIKADNIQKVSDGSNIIKKCGSTITLGSCGATISLACGATQTGFGQTYSAVEYCTTAKTSPFTAAAGTGYFVNTTCGAVTVTLPASPTAGDVVAFKDYASQWNTNNVTLCNNGNKINGVCATAKLSTQNQSVSLIYVDATKGWQDIQDSTAGVTGNAFITATGGTITCCGDYKIHTFTSDGTFTVTGGGGPLAVVDYLVVSGGGSGGTANGGYGAGAGGAGGFRLSNSTCMTAPLTSPLASPTGLPVSVTSYPVTVGGGGAGFSSPCQSNGNTGSNSVFSTITSTGGGYGAGGTIPNVSNGGNGGSGGGGWNADSPSSSGLGGSGNTPPTSPPQGNNGGVGGPSGGSGGGGGGGGGAGAVGGNLSPGNVGGIGGVGSYVIGTGLAGCNGTPGPVCGAKYFSGGGGGGSITGSPGGTGGGGKGGDGGTDPGIAGTANTGGGGGGTRAGTSGAGGSGIVIIRYKYQ